MLKAALVSLAELSERGHRTPSSALRELPVRFGRYGYVVRYRVVPDEVLVTRIFHVRERR